MIHIKNLSFGYKKNAKLFESLDLHLDAGNIYGLLGKNGAGKSTLLKLISGLRFPKEGDCEVMEFTPEDRLPDFLSDLYFLSEELYVPDMKIMAYKNTYAPFYPKFDHFAFENFLKEFEVETDKNLSTLSYGQKKKALLSFALATNCRLIIFDEPTNGLDIPSKSQFRRLLIGSIREDQTYLISTHQVRDMANLIDPIIILESGNIIFQESVHDITDRLTFQVMQDMQEVPNAIYSEPTPGGTFVVSPNANGETSQIDLEVLFNAVTQHTSIIQELFRKEVPA